MSPAPDEGGPGTRRATAVNAGWLVSERVVGMFATAAVAIGLGRMLGTEAFGAYSASLSLVLILSEISEMGFALLVPQELLARPRRERGSSICLPRPGI